MQCQGVILRRHQGDGLLFHDKGSNVIVKTRQATKLVKLISEFNSEFKEHMLPCKRIAAYLLKKKKKKKNYCSAKKSVFSRKWSRKLNIKMSQC